MDAALASEPYREVIGLFGRAASVLDSEGATDARGALVVAATGNESRRLGPNPYTIGVAPPAASDGFVRVSALSKKGIADFSNTGATVAAPGVEILSAKPGNQYALAGGTSMATPHVAGVAALWAEKLKSAHRLTLRDLRGRLEGTAQPVHDLGHVEIGSGLVQAPTE